MIFIFYYINNFIKTKVILTTGRTQIMVLIPVTTLDTTIKKLNTAQTPGIIRDIIRRLIMEQTLGCMDGRIQIITTMQTSMEGNEMMKII